jgi:hypothetical protein
MVFVDVIIYMQYIAVAAYAIRPINPPDTACGSVMGYSSDFLRAGESEGAGEEQEDVFHKLGL